MSTIQEEVHSEKFDLDKATAFKKEPLHSDDADRTQQSASGSRRDAGTTGQSYTGLGKKTSPIIGASALLASKYPSTVDEGKDTRSRNETRVVLMIVAVITALLIYGWSKWGDINFQQEIEFHYNMGLVGGIMMLVVLTYAMRKRFKFMRKMGNIESWYYFHLLGGVLGPIFIIFHSNFTMKSINATVAFVAMGLVVISGIVGRYIYTRIGYGLHKKLLSIKETEQSLIDSLRSHKSEAVEVIERRLSKFALASLAVPKTIFQLPLRFVAIRTAAATCYIRASEDLTLMLRMTAQEDGWNVDEYKTRLADEKRLLRDHINAVVEIARVHLFERLFVRWRILHIPLLYILLITGLVHVLAVHMY